MFKVCSLAALAALGALFAGAPAAHATETYSLSCTTGTIAFLDLSGDEETDPWDEPGEPTCETDSVTCPAFEHCQAETVGTFTSLLAPAGISGTAVSDVSVAGFVNDCTSTGRKCSVSGGLGGISGWAQPQVMRGRCYLTGNTVLVNAKVTCQTTIIIDP